MSAVAPPAEAARPSIPGNFTAVPQTSPPAIIVVVSWNRPTSDGGYALTGYEIEWRFDQDNNRNANWGTHSRNGFLTADSDATSVTFTDADGLRANNNYDFRITALNSNGERSFYSSDANATIGDVPVPSAPPTNLEVTQSSGFVTVSWAAPQGWITKYRYQFREPDEEFGSLSFTIDPPLTAITQNAFVGKVFRVAAGNAVGFGEWSEDFLVDPPPGQPTDLRVFEVPDDPAVTGDDPRRNRIRLTWTPPADHPDTGPITNYDYRTRDPDGSYGNVFRFQTFPPYHVHLLHFFDKVIQVRAENAAGEGEWSEEFHIPSDPDAPDPETPTVTLVLTPTRINESGSGNSATLTAALSSAVSGSATTVTVGANPAGAVDLSGTTLTIPAGQTASSGPAITVTAVDNSVDAPDARVTISGTVTESGRAGPAAVTLTVTDDDGGGGTVTPRPGTGGGGGGGGSAPRNQAPEAADTLAAAAVAVGASAAVDLDAAFDDPDGDRLDYGAESSDTSVATAAIDGATLTVQGLAAGTARITVTATDPDGESASQAFDVTVTGVERVWHLPPASDPALQGFVRVINHSGEAGEATVTATDDAGRAYGPLTLALTRRGAAHFNVQDLESGNPDKGLTGATGPGMGGWRLAVESDTLAVEALAYARAADGFLTPLDGTAPQGGNGALELATFNPGSNYNQVSVLRLVNPTAEDAAATVTGVDDAGRSPGAPVRLTVPAGAACMADAAELESGRGLACGEPQAGLGDGTGKWRLRIESDAPLTALGLLRSPTGHLSNLSGGALPADADGVRRVHLFPAASDPNGLQGFVRVANRSNRDGTVSIRASDGTDADYEVLTLALGANEAVQFNSGDLEIGNADKGLTGSTGPGRGDWALALSGDGIEFDVLAYVRSPDGFLAPMGASAPLRDMDGAAVRRVAFLNPGSNSRQASVLRLVNPGAANAQASIEGTDDTGLRPGAPVRVTVPAGGAVELTAAELESGDAGAIESGALGDGQGKWRLRIEADRPVAALSLASSPTGRLVNLSGADGSRGFKHGLLPPPAGVTLENPYECELLGRWDAAPGAPHAVDLLRGGERDAARSTERWTHPTRRWAGLCGAGSYSIRVCALNADGDCGPWSAESNAVTID